MLRRDEAEALLGATLGRYRVTKLLGRGGMGIVYLATDMQLGRPVALKVLPPVFVSDHARRDRFLREARSSAAAEHPNIASVYDVGEEDGRVFIAMECVAGSTLRAVVDAHPSGLPIDEVVRIGREIGRGLAKAHDIGIVHRDLKPDNVMIGREGAVKILDFGIAKFDDPALLETQAVDTNTPFITEDGRMLGTPGYMAPEQAKGQRVDPRADVFALGAVLYELATGRRAFEGDNAVELVIATDRDEPQPPTSRNPNVTPALQQIIARCLRKAPAERYPDGRAVAEALGHDASTMHVGRQGAVAHTPDEATASPPPRTRRWLLAALASLGVAGVALAFAFLGDRAPMHEPAASERPLLRCASALDARCNRSCKSLLSREPLPPSGVYPIDADGAEGAGAPLWAYCDMSEHGGGWTLVAKVNTATTPGISEPADFFDRTLNEQSLLSPTLANDGGIASLGVSRLRAAIAANSVVRLTLVAATDSQQRVDWFKDVGPLDELARWFVAPMDDLSATRGCADEAMTRHCRAHAIGRLAGATFFGMPPNGGMHLKAYGFTARCPVHMRLDGDDSADASGLCSCTHDFDDNAWHDGAVPDDHWGNGLLIWIR